MNNFLFEELLKQMRVVDFAVFKAHHKANLNPCQPHTFEQIAASIIGVSKDERGFKAMFEDGSSILIGFDGSYVRYNRLGQKQSSRKAGSETGICWQNHHIQIFIYGKRILLERFVAVCRDIMNNKLLMNYSDVTANVMDGSGSTETAEFLGIPYNIEFDNIEWCTRSLNTLHGHKIKKLYKLTGHVYRFSVFDDGLDIMMNSNNADVIKYYCENNLFRVR